MPEADTTYTSRSSQSINPKLNLTSLSLEQLLLMKLDLPVLSSRAKTLLSFKKERLLPSEMEPSRSSSLTSHWKLISLEESLLKMLKSRLPTQPTTSLKNKSKEDPEDQEEKVKTDLPEEKETTKEDPEEKVKTEKEDQEEKAKTDLPEEKEITKEDPGEKVKTDHKEEKETSTEDPEEKVKTDNQEEKEITKEDPEEKVKTDLKEEKEIMKEDPEEKVRTDHQEETKTEATEDHQSSSPRSPLLSQEMRDSTFSER